MADWVTISSLGTAGGTLALAVATFSSIRSANHSARVAERSLLAGLRPVLIHSREDDPVQRVRFGDGHRLVVPGHGAAAQETGGSVYLSIALRNGGSGLAVVHGWRARPRAASQSEVPLSRLDEFRRQQLDLLIPAGEVTFWLGAMRDPHEPGYDEVLAAVRAGEPLQVDLLYSDHEGGQRTVARFIVSDWPEEEGERATVVRYWSVDGADPH
ncbi:MAG: hypothetical protein ACRDNJ_02175 [Solirubrobacteraceae bacterium]